MKTNSPATVGVAKTQPPVSNVQSSRVLVAGRRAPTSLSIEDELASRAARLRQTKFGGLIARRQISIPARPSESYNFARERRPLSGGSSDRSESSGRSLRISLLETTLARQRTNRSSGLAPRGSPRARRTPPQRVQELTSEICHLPRAGVTSAVSAK